MGLNIQTGYNPEDIDRMHELEKLCFSRAFRWSKKDFIAALKECNVIVGTHDNKIVGYLLSEKDTDAGHIVSVVVDPAYQGNGFGYTLMKEAQAFYQSLGLKKMKLEVHVDNPAQVLYFKLGYRVTGVTPKYYSNGSTAITMCLSAAF